MNKLHYIIEMSAKGIHPSAFVDKVSETECTLTVKIKGNHIESVNKLRAFFGDSIVYDDIYFCPNIEVTTAYFITYDAI